MGGRCSRTRVLLPRVSDEAEVEWNTRLRSIFSTSCRHYDADRNVEAIAGLRLCFKSLSFALDFEYLHLFILPSLTDDVRSNMPVPLWTVVAEYACTDSTTFIRETLQSLHCIIAHCYSRLADIGVESVENERLAGFHASRALTVNEVATFDKSATMWMYVAVAQYNDATSSAKVDDNRYVDALYSVSKSISVDASTESFAHELKGRILIRFKLYMQALESFATVIALAQSPGYIRRAREYMAIIHALIERKQQTPKCHPHVTMKTWTSTRTSRAVSSIGEPYKPYAERMLYHAVDGATLVQMREQHLTQLGVSDPIHRLRLLSFIKRGL